MEPSITVQSCPVLLQESNMRMNDNTKRIVFVVLVAILVLSIILPFVAARFENEKGGFGHRHNRALLWALIIIRSISVITAVFWLAIYLYGDWLRSRVDTIKLAARMRIVASVWWWIIIALLVLLGVEFLIVLYRGSHRIVFASIEYVLLTIVFSCFLLFAWDNVQYFRKRSLCNIVAACLLERHEKYVKTRDFDKAYSALLKACETDPDGIWLWCKLALFCERTRKNSAEANSYMAKANELITANKANSISERAYYFGSLGLILYMRGEFDKSLAYIKQSIDIEPKPFRIKMYEELLSDSKISQPDTNPPDPKTVT